MASNSSDPSASEISEIISRSAAGDADAVQLLLTRYSSVIERELRTQRRFLGLQTRLDPEDIAQSVWRCFFIAIVGGDLAFREPNQVAAFLTRLTRNRIETQFRKHHAIKRDVRRTINSHELDFEVKSNTNPSHVASTLEFLQNVLTQMTPDERHIAKRREEGVTWEDLAQELGTTTEAIRKRHSRTARRILEELDPDNEST
jgi:RNA polymerase sigma factor (sigma-70 family)